MQNETTQNQNYEVIPYDNGKGQIVELKRVGEDMCATQEEMAKMFGVNRQAITKQLKRIFKRGELDEKVVCSILELPYNHGAIQGKNQIIKVKTYNFDAICSVGYVITKMKKLQLQ